jgi:hypothetical protein
MQYKRRQTMSFTTRPVDRGRSGSTPLVGAVVVLALLFACLPASHAALNAVQSAPYSSAFGFFPQWYQDTHGRALELCLSGPLCVLPGLDEGFDPTQPLVFPSNFPGESFWFYADGSVVAGNGSNLVDLRYVAALEAAFSAEVPNANDQVSFARIRVFADVPTVGTYTLTHPYGVEVFEVTEIDAGREIQFTRDIGIGAPGVFMGALNGDLGPFLVRTVGGVVSLITTATGTYIGDPTVATTVTGSPFATNFLRLQGPGINLTSNLFALAGKVYLTPLPTPLLTERTTYSRTASLTQVDVFASSAPAAVVGFAPPTTAMLSDSVGRFFGQATALPSTGTVTVVAELSPNTPVSSGPQPVTDVVSILRAEYSAGAHALIIEALSSDQTALPSLTLAPSTPLPLVGPDGVKSVIVTGLAIPPATVTVTSAAGGGDTEPVVVVP